MKYPSYTQMNTLNIIGAGRLGKTLAYLWHQAHLLTLSGIHNQSLQSAQRAVDFISGGQAIEHLEDMPDADLWLISVPDDRIEALASQLKKAKKLKAGNIVFQCSGALPCSQMAASLPENVHVASIHPIKSFAEPEQSITGFNGTYCGTEGDDLALQILRPLFTGIGAVLFEINPTHKILYHAAGVMASNYLTALMDVSLQLYVKSGVERETALKLIQPIANNVLANIAIMDTSASLTGPIARGDVSVIHNQINALSDWQPQLANLYKQLGQVALELARKQGSADNLALEQIQKQLGDKGSVA